MKISRQEEGRFGRIRLLFYPVERGLLLPRADLEEEEGGPLPAHSEDKDELS